MVRGHSFRVLGGVIALSMFNACSGNDRLRAVAPNTTEVAGPVASAGDDPGKIADALTSFARAPTAGAFATLRFAPTVRLALGPTTLRTVEGRQLVDPVAWRLDADDGYEGFAGPFSVLDTLAGAAAYDVTTGTHPRCAGVPAATPPEVDGFRQVAIRPRDIEACIQWFAVDLFLDAEGSIAMVRLDRFGP